MDYSKLENGLGYIFKDKQLLETALTHTTYVFEHGKGHECSNQRLEFIGDAVMDLVIGRKLYELKPNSDEGFLSKTRSIVVCEASFSSIARKLSLGDYLLLGKGEEQTNGRDKDSTLADTFEALIAAIYLDSDFDTVSNVALKLMDSTIMDACSGKIVLDYKSKLLELALSKGVNSEISFELLEQSGPDHNPQFKIGAYADHELLYIGTGRSKKTAEQSACKGAIDVFVSRFL